MSKINWWKKCVMLLKKEKRLVVDDDFDVRGKLNDFSCFLHSVSLLALGKFFNWPIYPIENLLGKLQLSDFNRYPS